VIWTLIISDMDINHLCPPLSTLTAARVSQVISSLYLL